jgi:hypothetical protein
MDHFEEMGHGVVRAVVIGAYAWLLIMLLVGMLA